MVQKRRGGNMGMKKNYKGGEEENCFGIIKIDLSEDDM